MKTVKIGFVGVGDISSIYLENITNLFKGLEIVGVCDLVRSKAEKAQEKYGFSKIYATMDELFADDEIQIVLNLTRPYEHFEVSKAALLAGKHVYSEKPLAATLEEGQKLVALAQEKNLMLGGAPDTYLGAGIQTCRKLIDNGFIGQPVGTTAFMRCRGHESWHPDPAFYYKHGGGPMMDMGPYYITALINLLGGVKRIAGMTNITFPQRMITSNPLSGTVVDVDVPTYINGLMEFECGAIGNILTTFDVVSNKQPMLEIYGSEGTLILPDPNTFGGPIFLLRREEKEYYEIPLTFGYKDNSRGLGLADMGAALQNGRDFRSNYHQTYHVLEIMTAFDRSSKAGSFVDIESSYTPGEPMKNSLLAGIFEE